MAEERLRRRWDDEEGQSKGERERYVVVLFAINLICNQRPSKRKIRAAQRGSG
jgi:hypothetical protein